MFATSSIIAGWCEVEDFIKQGVELHIDGPANVRSKPNGKILYSLAQDTAVHVEKTTLVGKAKWYLVRWQQSGKTLKGWTHQQNIFCKP